MERMDMHSRNEYLKVIREKYFKVRTKKEKSQILNEYCSNTGQSRKHVIRKIHKTDPGPKQRKKRKEMYDGQVKAALAKIWEIFDYSCGQRLKPLLETEVDRLSELGEIEISEETALKLKKMTLYKYCSREKLEFTRSRENKKNDNAYVEQKNWTHVRKVFGYLRYDTPEELMIINDLYHNELRVYKNFFQPVMKLASKVRVGGKVKREYEPSKTPYQRLTESDQIRDEVKEELKGIYLSLNPAQLKRSIDDKLARLYKAYQEKGRTQQVDPYKKLAPRTASFYMIQQPSLR